MEKTNDLLNTYTQRHNNTFIYLFIYLIISYLYYSFHFYLVI